MTEFIEEEELFEEDDLLEEEFIDDEPEEELDELSKEFVAKLIEKGLSLPTLAFSSADELRPKLSELNPKAVFIDVHLTEGSGLPLIPEMRQYWPYIPFIVITADKSDNFLTEALSRGADDFIRKPIKIPELKARLQKRWDDQVEKQSLSVLTFDDITIDSAHHLLKGPVSMRSLSPTELRLVNRLA